jgi:Holliday junction resolvase RusA-like endonuclease
MNQWTFPLNPVAASRPRTGRYGGYYVGPYKVFREEAAIIVPQVVGDWEPLSGWLGFSGVFSVKRPKNPTYPYPVPDIDNYLKAVFDVCNGRIWVDDKQIIKLHDINLIWAPPGDEGCFKIKVWEVE